MAKLKPRARLIRTIGDKLISGPEAAIIELVKNSYDADSPSVEIVISPPTLTNNGKITINDFGHGMTYNNILNDWLEPATDIKSKDKKSKSGKRTVLGAKGVGRFASASLGRNISLISVAKIGDIYQTSSLVLDWSIFESHKYLDDIDIDIKKLDSQTPKRTGVFIEITNLSTIWDEKKVRKLVRELRRLATPQNETETPFDIYLDLKHFQITNPEPYNFNGQQLLFETNRIAEVIENTDKNSEHETSKTLITPYKISKESDYYLKGSFDSKGNFSGTFTIVRGDNIPQLLKLTAPLIDIGELSCGEVNVELRLYDLEKESVEKLFERMGLKFADFGLRNARAMIAENTGVGIYRTGFRIRPYGEPDNDWLRLENRRVQNPSKRIGHGQISGTISVSSEIESNLIERSSREGLETNSAYDRLILLITNLLVKVEQKRFDFRAKAGISRQPAKRIDKARELSSLESITKAVGNLSEEDQKPLLLKIEKESKALTKALDEIEAYQRLLESRAALGMVVAQVIHDGRTYLDPISSSAKSIIKNAPLVLEDSKKGELIRQYYPTYGKAILDGSKGLASLFKSLDPISGRRRGRPVEFSAMDNINNTLNLLDELLIDHAINVQVDVDEKLKLYGFSGDLQSALMNILHNAIHWLTTTENSSRIIEIHSKVEESIAKIYVSNNGPIIDEQDRESIFEAGFSLKSDGHGLGLSIAKEACKNSNGDLHLDFDSIDTCFVISYPISQ
ncbi:sensor histidine kinase [Vibrio vulnificus]|uniref:sensor histidine kinase n=1 Tax=Vibrio vulnificus TaxID=672 RepID=UPI000A3AAA63|nr:sensor histidine kinase [Vibrio vulnificus]EHI9274375.1 sensor histidine kinase [Vibrio vulnificus]EHI9275373.1 sensor histidine kinase [Vibrio vulnificus]EME0811696.1 sensor histidine kinase [Vibrio vulnificus]EME0812793.1 sensor histidine kinase [Vibrio vulnificus]OUD76438.1 putative two-component system sensor histidine kinase, putative heat shock protein [Vibrio vulnificus]